jgi:hypothetical protein
MPTEHSVDIYHVKLIVKEEGKIRMKPAENRKRRDFEANSSDSSRRQLKWFKGWESFLRESHRVSNLKVCFLEKRLICLLADQFHEFKSIYSISMQHPVKK